MHCAWKGYKKTPKNLNYCVNHTQRWMLSKFELISRHRHEINWNLLVWEVTCLRHEINWNLLVWEFTCMRHEINSNLLYIHLCVWLTQLFKFSIFYLFKRNEQLGWDMRSTRIYFTSIYVYGWRNNLSSPFFIYSWIKRNEQ